MFKSSFSRTYRRTIFLLLGLLVCAIGAQAQGNPPPQAVNDSYTVHRQITVPAPGVFGNDYWPGMYYYNVDTNPQYGTLNHFYWNGNFAYTPEYGFIGTDSFNYTICNSSWACSSATVTLNVVNSPPTAPDQSFNVHRSLSLPAPGFLASVSDPD